MDCEVRYVAAPVSGGPAEHVVEAHRSNGTVVEVETGRDVCKVPSTIVALELLYNVYTKRRLDGCGIGGQELDVDNR